LRIEKSRRRDPRAIDYGGYILIDETNNSVLGRYWVSIDDVEKYLLGDSKDHVKSCRGDNPRGTKKASR